MQQARITANTERAREALHRIHRKDGKTIREKLAYKAVLTERWLDGDKSQLEITVKNRQLGALIKAEDFIRAVHFDMSLHNVPEKEYEVEAND